MIHPKIRREIAERYHRALPDEIRNYLKGRGVPATLIERQLLGWNGERITVPIFGRERGEVLGFRYLKGLGAPEDAAEAVTDLQLGTELYGWETLMRTPQRVVICDRELDRLVLEANGFPAVVSTGGAGEFLKAWVPYFEPVRRVYLCFARSLTGAAAAAKLQRFMPRACIVTLPAEVGANGTVTEFFVDLGRTRLDFEVLLAAAEASFLGPPGPPNVREFRPLDKPVRRRAERLKRAVRLHDIVAQDTDLEASGGRLIGHCPFHDGLDRSFAVDPASDTYSCSVCGARGDVLQFLTDKESMTVGQALEALERFQFTHELYGTSS